MDAVLGIALDAAQMGVIAALAYLVGGLVWLLAPWKWRGER